MKRLTLSTLVLGAAISTAAPALADVRVGVVIQRPGSSYRVRYNVVRIGFDNGYRDGLREGERDDRRDDRYNFRDEGRWRDGDYGYRVEYGRRYEYVSAYRRGFEEGYRRGYANRPVYGRRLDLRIYHR